MSILSRAIAWLLFSVIVSSTRAIQASDQILSICTPEAPSGGIYRRHRDGIVGTDSWEYFLPPLPPKQDLKTEDSRYSSYGRGSLPRSPPSQTVALTSSTSIPSRDGGVHNVVANPLPTTSSPVSTKEYASTAACSIPTTTVVSLGPSLGYLGRPRYQALSSARSVRDDHHAS